MAGVCDLCLIVVESRIPSDVQDVLRKQGVQWAHLGAELRFFLGEKTVWCDMGRPDMSSAASRPDRRGAENRITLDEWREEVDKRLGALLKDVKKKDDINIRDLETLGAQLWYGLLPEKLRTRIEKAAKDAGPGNAPVLRVHSQMDWIPWEIMRLGTDYLGVRFQIARLPLLHVVYPGETAPRLVASIHNLLGKGALKGALLGEWESTFLFPAPHVVSGAVHSYPSSQDHDNYPRVGTLETALKKGANIVHITCTGKTRLARGGRIEPYWTLDEDHRPSHPYEVDTRVLERPEMSDPIKKHRPLVFANACGSAEAGRHLGDFGPCFIQLGAVAFVGAFANINKDVAVKFAHRFYEQLLIPEEKEKDKIHRTIGQALWQTKKAFSDEGELDPSYLFYRLYGPPDTCFQLDSGK